jgi:competence protein ComEC
MNGLLLSLLGFVLGSALQLQQTVLLGMDFYAGLMLFGLLAHIPCASPAIKRVANKHRSSPLISALHGGVILLMAMGVGFGLAGLRAVGFSSSALDPALEARDLEVVGVVSSMPQRSEAGLRFRFAVESARRVSPEPVTEVSLPPRIELSWYKGLVRSEDAAEIPYAELMATAPDVQPGDRWSFTVRLKAPHGNLNPHGFDYELWQWEQGVQATGYIRATAREGARDAMPRRVGVTWSHPVERMRAQVRDAIFLRIADDRAAGVVAALVVGDQSAIDRADWDVFRATGVAHLMSISGLHVTMFAWVAAALIGALWRRSMRLTNALATPHAALLGGVMCAAAYALFAGWAVPAQRTVWMLLAVTLLRLANLRWPWPLVWLWACAVVVLIDPWALMQAGFWLSFVAVGVLFASSQGHSEAASEAAAPRTPVRAALAALALKAREQWVVTLALAPLSLWLFNQTSVVGLLANMLAIPWITLLVTPLALLGLIWAPVWQLAAGAVQLLGAVLQPLSMLPMATLSVPSSGGWLGALALLGALLLIMRLPLAVRACGLVMMLPMLLYSPPRPAHGEFELLAADIGQGNAVLVRTASHSLLYDAGPSFSRESDAGQRTLVPLLRALGERLDVLMVSHRDSDHVGGAAVVLRMQTTATLHSSLEDGHELFALRENTRCTAGQRWQWDSVEFEILHPQPADYGARAKPNAISCVLRIRSQGAAGPQTALLTGDIEAAQEARLVIDQMPLKADLLLVPHHGSKTSSTDAFLDQVQPSIAIIQAGYRNRFQHPAPVVRERYAQRHIRLLDSPRCGAALWRSASPDAMQCQRQRDARYWHHRMELPAGKP